MSMKWVKGRTVVRSFPRTASTVFTKNSLVYWISGLVAPADSTSGDHIGICMEDVAATDADYATAAVPIMVECPADKQCVMECDVTGTLLTTDVGVAMDLSSALVVNQDATAKAVVTCVGFQSTSKGLFVLNSTYDVLRVATT